jgi:hypothetical protein
MRLVLTLLVMSSAASADVTPLSRLPSRPAHIEHDVPILKVVAPYCTVAGGPITWAAGDGDLDLERRASEAIHDWNPDQSDGALALERLIEHDGHAELERTTISAMPGGWVAERGRIALVRVGQVDATTIYAYRRGSDVFLVMRASSATIQFDSNYFMGGGHRDLEMPCDHAITQLRLREQASQIATIWAPKECVGVDASISKTSRDREPLLAVAARHVPCQ